MFHQIRVVFKHVRDEVFIFSLILILTRSVHAENENNNDSDADSSGFICEDILTDSKTHPDGNLPIDRVRMLKKCHQNYTANGNIASNCERWPVDENSLQNLFLFLPVTGLSKNITYWNMYCALCNYDNQFEFWYPLLYYIMEERCDFNFFLVRKFVLDSKIWWPQRRKNLFKNWYSRVLASKDVCNQTTLKFLPDHLKNKVEECDKTLEKARKSNYDTISNSTYQAIRRKYCDGDVSRICPTLRIRNQVSCAYGVDDGNICAENQFLWEGINFAYGEHSDIFLAPYEKNVYRFNRDEYSNETDTDAIDLIYLCGKTQHRFNMVQIFTYVTYLISVIFLLIYLIFFPIKRDLRNLPRKALYSYCIVQMIYSFYYVVNKFAKLCILTNLVLLYTRSSSFLWTTVVVFEYACLAYYSIRNQKIYSQDHKQKYLAYCFVCWVVPAIPIIVALLPVTEDVELYSCPDLPVYSLVQCFCNWTNNLYLNLAFQMQKLIMNVCCITTTCVFIGISWAFFNLSNKRRLIRSTAHTNLLVVFIKVACTVSFYAIFKMLYFASPVANDTFNDLYHLIDSFQGIFIFFTFCFEKNMVTDFTAKFKFKKQHTEQNDKNNADLACNSENLLIT